MKALHEIFDTYLKKVQYNIWIIRCNEMIEIGKQMGISKDLKRKKVVREESELREVDRLENLENKKKRKKSKQLQK